MKMLVEIDTDTQAVVPKVPIKEMLEKGNTVYWHDQAEPAEVWEAMIATAPLPDPVQSTQRSLCPSLWIRETLISLRHDWPGLPDWSAIHYRPGMRSLS